MTVTIVVADLLPVIDLMEVLVDDVEDLPFVEAVARHPRA